MWSYCKYHCFVALTKANYKYSSKLSEGKSTRQVLYSLRWTVDELDRLVKDGRQLYVDVASLRSSLHRSGENIPKNILAGLRLRLTDFVKLTTRQRRVAATHVLVIMISSEERNVKPYALPVQCIPYVSITHEMMRFLINTLIKEMVGRNMSVAGEVCVLCVFMWI